MTSQHQNYVKIFTDGSKSMKTVMLQQCNLLSQIAPFHIKISLLYLHSRAASNFI